MKDMEIIFLKTADLIPYENNPRHNDEAVEEVSASISRFGFKVPIIIDKNNVIVAGHTRLKASQALGLEKVPCIRADDLTDDQIKAFRLADNKVSERSTWDEAKLSIELDEIEMDMSEFGFDLDIDPIEIEEDDPESDDVPEPPAEARTKRGDIYQLGDHRLMCGDATSITDVDALMDGKDADMAYTDPPYGMDLDTDYSSMVSRLDFATEKNAIGGKKYDQGQVDDFQPEMINSVFALNAKETFLWGCDYYAELIPDRNDGSWIVWDKRANGNDDIEEDYSSDKMYGSCFELCWSKKRHKRDIARVKWAGVFGTEQEFDHKRWHPTQKPVKLACWFLERYSSEGQIIVDLFGGSGSTLIACEQLGRQCFMMELDEKYCDVIVSRWESLTGQKAILLNEI